MKKLGIFFKGGLAKGLGGVGVIRFLQEEGIKPHIYAGSSSGALVAGAAAKGWKWEDILDAFTNIKFRKVTSFKSIILKKTLVDYSKYKKEFNKFANNTNIQDLESKLVVCVTDPNTAKRVFVDKGNLSEALIATTGFPFGFPYTRIEGKRYLDGDLSSSYSTKELKKRGAEIVIGVGHIRKPRNQDKLDGIRSKLEDVYLTMLWQIQDYNNIIDPPDLELLYGMDDKGLYDFDAIEEASNRAYKAAKSQKKQIIKLLS